MSAKLCGAKTRGGGKCKQPRGAGTDHPGSGRCKFHGGSSRNGRKAAGRERSLEFARGVLGAEVAVDAMDALEQSVRLTAGMVDFWRFELAEAAAAQASAKTDEDRAAAGVKVRELAPQYAEALKLQKDVAKAATDAGVAERRQVLAERIAGMIAAALQDALSAVAADVLTAEVRSRIVRDFTGRLLVLEAQEEPAPLRALPGGR